jgi:Xaa-Pro aminopeptidase
MVRTLCLGLALACAASADNEPRVRREALAKALPDGVIVMFGRAETDSDDLRSGFFQQPDFFYLTGCKEPGAVLLIEPGERGLAREILFLPTRDPKKEQWTGRKLAPGDPDLATRTGFEIVLGTERLEAELRASMDRKPVIYTVGPAATASLKTMAPLRTVASAKIAIARLRMRKSEAEIAAIQRATDVTLAAHRAAWKAAAPGMYEYQVAALMTSHYGGEGCERSAYAPIVGSGPNALVLHYSRNGRRMDLGDLLLMDVGAECAGYTADVTRTIPIGGKFTARQREIYEIVLGAQKAAIAAIKPGMSFAKNQPGSLYRIAYDYINTHGKDTRGQPLGQYFLHGLSHHVGLEVHDAWDPEQPLEAGMVITVEPGIYIADEGIGVRIEDTVLVTKDGARVMSEALPREVAEIEKLVGK